MVTWLDVHGLNRRSLKAKPKRNLALFGASSTKCVVPLSYNSSAWQRDGLCRISAINMVVICSSYGEKTRGLTPLRPTLFTQKSAMEHAKIGCSMAVSSLYKRRKKLQMCCFSGRREKAKWNLRVTSRENLKNCVNFSLEKHLLIQKFSYLCIAITLLL